MKHRVIMFPLVLTMLLLLFPVFASANSFVA